MLTKAQNASEANKEAGAKDKVATEVYASYDNDEKVNAETLKANFEARGYKVTKGGTSKDEFPVSVIVDGYTFEIDSKAVITSKGIQEEIVIPHSAKEVADAPETYYGKTVNYSANGITDWKIFYSNETNIFLITSGYLPQVKIPSGAGMNKSGTYNACWSSPPSSIDTANRKDDLFMTGTVGDGENSNCVSKLLNTGLWQTLLDGNYADCAIGSPTIEMWKESWNDMYPSDKIKCRYWSYGYQVDWNSGSYSDNHILGTEMTPKTGYNNALYFPPKGQNCDSYWIASPGNLFSNCVMDISTSGYVGSTSCGCAGVGIRPVVCLKDGVGVTEGKSDYEYDLINTLEAN